MTDKTPTLVEEIYALQTRGPLASDPPSYAAGAMDALCIAARHEQAWQAKLAKVEAELNDIRGAAQELVTESQRFRALIDIVKW
jgi:hypothetical protein